jgi:hypothetical protein
MSTKAEFLKSLDRSNEVVNSWPIWKQSIWEPLPLHPKEVATSSYDSTKDCSSENLHEVKNEQ